MAKAKFIHYAYGVEIYYVDKDSYVLQDNIFGSFNAADEYIKNDLIPGLHSYLYAEYDIDDWSYDIIDGRNGQKIANIHIRTFYYCK